MRGGLEEATHDVCIFQPSQHYENAKLVARNIAYMTETGGWVFELPRCPAAKASDSEEESEDEKATMSNPIKWIQGEHTAESPPPPTLRSGFRKQDAIRNAARAHSGIHCTVSRADRKNR